MSATMEVYTKLFSFFSAICYSRPNVRKIVIVETKAYTQYVSYDSLKIGLILDHYDTTGRLC